MNDRKEEKNPQMKPDGGHISTERFQSMSPSQLAEEMEQVLGAMTEETYDPALIDAYLDALDEKAPMPPAPDPEASLERLAKKLEEMPIKKVKKEEPQKEGRRATLRRVLTTAAAAACLLVAFGAGAWASGVDVVGNLVQWTNERLWMIFPSESGETSEYYEPFRRALEERGLPGELAPSWYPPGFRSEGSESWDNELSTTVFLTLSLPNSDRTLTVSVDRYKDPDHTTGAFEKDASSVETFISQERRFYLFSNTEVQVALWGDGDLQMSIVGDVSVDEIKEIIRSMGGA